MIYKSHIALALVLACSQVYSHGASARDDFERMGRNPTLQEEDPSFEELTSDPLPSRAEVVEITRVPTCNPRFDCTLIVGIRGEITHTTVTLLNRIIAKTRRQAEADKVPFHFGAVELNSPGGSVNAAMAIGRIVRKEEAGAFVNGGAVCLSSCVLILAGGSFRSFEGKVGIHRPYLPVPSGDVSSQNVKAIYAQMLQDLRAYFREMNVADGLADAMLRTNPERIRLLSHEELATYGLTPVDPIAAESFDLLAAKSYGLDRQEYMRRKVLAESRCGGPASVGSQCYRSILENGY
jgi:hypothetical protein